MFVLLAQINFAKIASSTVQIKTVFDPWDIEHIVSKHTQELTFTPGFICKPVGQIRYIPLYFGVLFSVAV